MQFHRLRSRRPCRSQCDTGGYWCRLLARQGQEISRIRRGLHTAAFNEHQPDRPLPPAASLGRPPPTGGRRDTSSRVPAEPWTAAESVVWPPFHPPRCLLERSSCLAFSPSEMRYLHHSCVRCPCLSRELRIGLRSCRQVRYFYNRYGVAPGRMTSQLAAIALHLG